MGILVKPLITEKATELSEDRNIFTFVVEKAANKVEIKKAVEELYGVNVERVSTRIMPGKRKSRYTKAGVISGTTGSFKKS